MGRYLPREMIQFGVWESEDQNLSKERFGRSRLQPFAGVFAHLNSCVQFVVYDGFMQRIIDDATFVATCSNKYR
jgi:hypothetical protein